MILPVKELNKIKKIKLVKNFFFYFEINNNYINNHNKKREEEEKKIQNCFSLL